MRQRRRLAPSFVASEYFIQDFNTFGGLALPPGAQVGILSQTTKGRPERSTRYPTCSSPPGFRSRCARRSSVGGRATRERCTWRVEPISTISRLRTRRHWRRSRHWSPRATSATSLRFDAAREPRGPSAPGLVILGPRNEIEMVTPPARELLAAMETQAAPGSQNAPAAVLALAGFARGQRTGRGDAMAVPTSQGWVTLHASLPDGEGDRVAIVLERAVTAQSTAVRLETDGVTAREREIAALLAQGLARNPEIARTLVLSPRYGPGGPHQEPVREDRRVDATGTGGPDLPRRLPAERRRGRTAEAAFSNT